MDVDFDSPVNIERPPAPLSFNPDSHEPALPSSPPPSTMPLSPLEPTNHRHISHQQLSHPPLQLQQEPQVPDEPSAPAISTDTTPSDRPTPSNDTEPAPQLEGASAAQPPPTADDNAMDTTLDDNTPASGPNDTPNDANPSSSHQAPASGSQPPHSTDNNPADGVTVWDSVVMSATPAGVEQPPVGSGAPQPQDEVDMTQDQQPVERNTDVDEDDQDDQDVSGSYVSDDEDNDKSQEDAYWADIEEDTSSPSEEELKDMTEDDKRTAFEYDHWEKSFFSDVGDPEYRPCEKARVTWKFKGVRGTKENPNRETIMRSPAAYVGGYYWTIKFFPRGNCVSALSVYIECSRTPPPPVPELSEMEFKVLKGAPDAVLSDQTPEVHIAPIAGKDLISETNQTESEGQDQPGQGETTSSASAPDAESSENPEAETSGDEEDWRIPAQIGLVLYNPNETRANHTQSSAHQFNNHNPDWGWTNFHGPWDEIHKRQRCQYQALLRDDTLAFDAYIQMYEDPTQSLWWHSSSEEPVWNSYAITGYAPMGDTDLNHRAEVAALISWCHLAPFRDVVKNIDVVANMTDSKIRPRPLAFSLQKVLAWLQLERRANGSVMPEPVLRELQGQDELSGNVVDFWERLRRSLELEMGPDTNVSQQLSKIFDSQKVADDSENSVNYLPSDSNSVIRVPAKNAGSVQSAVSKYLEQRPGKWSLPEVLTVELDRQEFDKEAGRWIVDFNRVTLDEELALGKSVVDGQTGEYSLYGYVVHNGKRTSGEYYSILRPAGPGSKWLAFDDGRPNKVQCLTRKAALEGHCGLGPGEAKDPEETYHVAVIVMYIRNDVIKNYLGFKLMPIDLPSYHVYALAHNVSMMLAPEDSIQQQCDNRGKANVPVEVYSSPNLDLLHSLFDGYDLMSCARSNGSVRCLSVPSGTSYNDLREKLALWDSPNNRDTIDRIRFWYICRSPDQGWLHEDNLIHISNIYDGISVIFPGDVVRLWMDVVSEDEAHLFSIPHRVESSDVFERQSEQVTPTPAPVQVSEAEVDGETNAEQSGSGNSETIPPERPETPRASGNEPRVVEDADIPMQDGDGSEVVPSAAMTADAVGDGNTQAVEPVVEPVVEQAAEPPAEPEASNPGLEEQQTNGDVAMQDVVDNDAAIAAVIANDLEEFESSQAMQAEPTPPPEIPVVPVPEPLSVPQNNDELPPQPEPEEPMREEPADQENATLNREENAMDVTEDIPAADENEAPINAPEPLKFEPPVGHVYYFLQIFDAHKQEFRFAGRYFAREEDSVKETICHVLKWPEDKEFLVWARFQNDMRSVDTSRSMARAAGGQGFGCFVVKERLSDTEISKLTKECLFEAPRALARYLWASSRGHPTDAFTGTKVIDDSITGDHYSGELVKGFYHGKGTHISDAGIVYTGDFVQGYREGQGRMEYPSGDTYEGDWLENQRHGQGTFIERRTGNKYVGGYREGKRHGKGISYWEVADEEMDLCQICYGEDQDALFYDCGHVCACVTCAKQVDICPMCRKNVINVVRIYKT